MEKKDKNNLFLDKEFCAFYQDFKHEQDNITDMLDGNICRMCVCEDEKELYTQFFNANKRLVQLLELQKKKFKKQEELGY